jgi:hypothetical protein
MQKELGRRFYGFDEMKEGRVHDMDLLRGLDDVRIRQDASRQVLYRDDRA